MTCIMNSTLSQYLRMHIGFFSIIIMIEKRKRILHRNTH